MTIFVVSCEGNQFFRLNYELLLLVFEISAESLSVFCQQ